MSWDRARSIPWSRISTKSDINVEAYREQVWSEMNREAAAMEEKLVKGNVSGKEVKIPYSTGELIKMGAFGATIGGITGAVFGFMEGMRTVGENAMLKNASNTAKGRYLLQGTTRSSVLFGGFFGGFHILKYGFRILAQERSEWTEIGVAGAISMGALMSKPSFRPSMPYCGMLILMDGVHIFMRDMDK